MGQMIQREEISMIFQKLNAPHLNAQIAEDGTGPDVYNEIVKF